MRLSPAPRTHKCTQGSLLEGDDVSHLALGSELQAGGHIHIVKRSSEGTCDEAIGCLRASGHAGKEEIRT